MKVAGIIYLHEISQNRMFGSSRKNLDMFNKICGQNALKNVVLTTTKWAAITEDMGERRERQLADTYWKEMIRHGSTMARFKGTQASGWEIIGGILSKRVVDFVLIQEELVELQRLIPQTEAGQTLRYTLQELLKQQQELARELEEQKAREGGEGIRKWEQNKQRIGSLLGQIHQLKVPLGARIKGFLGL